MVSPIVKLKVLTTSDNVTRALSDSPCGFVPLACNYYRISRKHLQAKSECLSVLVYIVSNVFQKRQKEIVSNFLLSSCYDFIISYWRHEVNKNLRKFSVPV